MTHLAPTWLKGSVRSVVLFDEAMSVSTNEERLEVLRFVRDTEFELPVLSSIATKLLQSMHDERADAASVAKLITADQGLAAHVLRLANSPYYRGRCAVGSLQQAIARLGLTTVFEMALAVCFAATAFRIRGYEEARRTHVALRIWRAASWLQRWRNGPARRRRRARSMHIWHICAGCCDTSVNPWSSAC